MQKDGLVYPVRVWRDAERGVSRMDTFGGRNVLISTKVELQADIKEQSCLVKPAYIWHLKRHFLQLMRDTTCRIWKLRSSQDWRSLSAA